MLRVENFSKRFGPVQALRDVSFAVRQGEILGLIGPNGAGKTTLFECLAGVMPADSGTIFHKNQPLAPSGRSPLLYYMPDAIAPWPSQSVSWALDFTLGFFGGSPGNRTVVIKELDLQPLLAATIGTLSKGQLKRVLLALALLTSHPILFADEPFDGLDLRQTRDVARVFRAKAAAGRTFLLSIHQIADAARVCDRFVLLSGGQVRGEGTLAELSAQAAIRTGSSTVTDLEEVFLALT